MYKPAGDAAEEREVSRLNGVMGAYQLRLETYVRSVQDLLFFIFVSANKSPFRIENKKGGYKNEEQWNNGKQQQQWNNEK